MDQQQPNPYRPPQSPATTRHTPWLARICVYTILSAVGIWLAAMLLLGIIALL